MTRDAAMQIGIRHADGEHEVVAVCYDDSSIVHPDLERRRYLASQLYTVCSGDIGRGRGQQRVFRTIPLRDGTLDVGDEWELVEPQNGPRES